MEALLFQLGISSLSVLITSKSSSTNPQSSTTIMLTRKKSRRESLPTYCDASHSDDSSVQSDFFSDEENAACPSKPGVKLNLFKPVAFITHVTNNNLLGSNAHHRELVLKHLRSSYLFSCLNETDIGDLAAQFEMVVRSTFGLIVTMHLYLHLYCIHSAI